MIQMKISRSIVNNFWNIVRRDYNLVDWKLEWWDCDGEAECADDFKTILLGECDTAKDAQYLLLHEVAHILAGPTNMHKPVWWQQFMELLKKYNFKKHPEDNYKDYYNPEAAVIKTPSKRYIKVEFFGYAPADLAIQMHVSLKNYDINTVGGNMKPYTEHKGKYKHIVNE